MKKPISVLLLIILLLFVPACRDVGKGYELTDQNADDTSSDEFVSLSDEVSGYKKIHVYVALCDNRYQGIVPVPAGIGNGQDADSNLYWGCEYGVRTYFKKSDKWSLVKQIKNPKRHILERIILKNTTAQAYLVADAYDGQYIKDATIDMLKATSGDDQEYVEVEDMKLVFGGGADLVAYIGHNGLMDFSLDAAIQAKDDKKRQAVILACASSSYFKNYIIASGANPLLWTTQLMCPEAYTLEAALEGYLLGESDQSIYDRAAGAYSNLSFPIISTKNPWVSR
ncbi:MAG: hypothetical protein FWG14_12570 [Peptococcaceae bacterium]|nr:hypothetical protein [Peptococcaceae bacterium]